MSPEQLVLPVLPGRLPSFSPGHLSNDSLVAWHLVHYPLLSVTRNQESELFVGCFSDPRFLWPKLVVVTAVVTAALELKCLQKVVLKVHAARDLLNSGWSLVLCGERLRSGKSCQKGEGRGNKMVQWIKAIHTKPKGQLEHRNGQRDRREAPPQGISSDLHTLWQEHSHIYIIHTFSNNRV